MSRKMNYIKIWFMYLLPFLQYIPRIKGEVYFRVLT